MNDQSFGVIPIRRQDRRFLFLLVQHHAGHWAFPKGHAEHGETAIQAARRELREETGISAVQLLQDAVLSETYYFKRDQQTVAKTVRYYIGIVGDAAVQIQAAEIKDYRWVSFDEATRLITFSESRRVLSTAQEYLTQRLKQRDVRLLGEV